MSRSNKKGPYVDVKLREKVEKLNEQGKRVHESIIEAPAVSMGQNLATYLLQSEQIRSAVPSA